MAAEPQFSNADLALISWLVRRRQEDDDYVLPFPPEEEIRIRRLKGLARLERKIRAARRARRQAAAPPPY